jgi:excisionase family DNA binding protein
MKPPNAAPERLVAGTPPPSRQARGPEWLPPSHEYSRPADEPRAGGLAVSSEIGQRLLTPADVAEHCQISTKTVLRAIQSGRLHASRLGTRGVYRMRPEDVEDWLRATSFAPAARRPGHPPEPSPMPRTNAAGRLTMGTAGRDR